MPAISQLWLSQQGAHIVAPLSRGFIIVSQTDIPRGLTMLMLGVLSPLLFSHLHSHEDHFTYPLAWRHINT